MTAEKEEHLAKLPGKAVRWCRWRNYSGRPWYRLFVAGQSLRTGALARTLNVSYNRAALIRDLFAD